MPKKNFISPVKNPHNEDVTKDLTSAHVKLFFVFSKNKRILKRLKNKNKCNGLINISNFLFSHSSHSSNTIHFSANYSYLAELAVWVWERTGATDGKSINNSKI